MFLRCECDFFASHSFLFFLFLFCSLCDAFCFERSTFGTANECVCVLCYCHWLYYAATYDLRHSLSFSSSRHCSKIAPAAPLKWQNIRIRHIVLSVIAVEPKIDFNANELCDCNQYYIAVVVVVLMVQLSRLQLFGYDFSALTHSGWFDSKLFFRP